jgi:hypothetical protein
MRNVSFFELSTGDIVGSVRANDLLIGANTPAGCGVIDGIYDISRSRVVQADDGFGNSKPVVIKCKPPRPSDSESVVWDWDEVADEWVPSQTLVARRAALRSVRNAGLQATDGPAIAAMEALLVAAISALGVPVPEDVRALLEHRQALRSLPQRGDFDQLSVVDVPRYAGAASQGV